MSRWQLERSPLNVDVKKLGGKVLQPVYQRGPEAAPRHQRSEGEKFKGRHHRGGISGLASAPGAARTLSDPALNPSLPFQPPITGYVFFSLMEKLVLARFLSFPQTLIRGETIRGS